jgi:hypothetical protein
MERLRMFTRRQSLLTAIRRFAIGIRAARPHTRTFTSVNTAADLSRLSRMVRLRT